MGARGGSSVYVYTLRERRNLPGSAAALAAHVLHHGRAHDVHAHGGGLHEHRVPRVDLGRPELRELRSTRFRKLLSPLLYVERRTSLRSIYTIQSDKRMSKPRMSTI